MQSETTKLPDELERVTFAQYGDTMKSIPLAELLDRDLWLAARVENSGSEGYYVEVCRWSDERRRYERYCFAKFLGGEIQELSALLCAMKVCDTINEAQYAEHANLIHHMPDWEG